MGKQYEQLNDRLREFILAQKMFFVGSAPLGGEGRINVSPKGMDSLRILDPTTVAYVDLTGSGIETIAHLKENGRMVMMFCSFDRDPLIVRLHGTGSVVERHDPEWAELIALFPEYPTARAVIKLSAERITDSCGWGVPKYEYVGEREQYPKYAAQQGEEGLRRDQLKWNQQSIDGLPGLEKPSV